MNLGVYDAPMPTKNPRLTITLQPSLAVTLRRLSDLTGNSQSSIITEALEGAEHVFSRVVQVLEAAEKAKAQLKGRSAQTLDRAQAQIEAQLQIVLNEFDSSADRSLGVLQMLSDSTPAGRSSASPVAASAPERRSASDGSEGGLVATGKRRRSAVASASEVAEGGGLTPLSNRGVRSLPGAMKKSPRRGRNGSV
jgi:hypothetical protein